MRKLDEIPLFNADHNFYKDSFFPIATIEWNNLDQTYTLFHFRTPKLNRPSSNSFYNCESTISLNIVTTLHLHLSHLRE